MLQPAVATCVAVVGMGAHSSYAQHAIVAVSHNDPDGRIAPGESVRISATIAWSGGAAYLQEISGDLRAAPDVGVASAASFPYQNYATSPLTLVNPGTPIGGSVRGLHIFTGAQQWVFFGIVAYPWYQATKGIEFLRFDWTAPNNPGIVMFDFVADPLLPEPTFLGPPLTAFPLPTTYLGTSLTVIPAPASALVLGLGLLGGAGLGRRHQ